MKWFKFYGQDYLSDPKMLALTASERSCWITLLAYASVNDNGMITFLNEQQLMMQAGISLEDEEWEKTKGVLKKFEKMAMITLDNANDNGMITINNWRNRQEIKLTPYERVKKYREKKKNDNAMIINDNANDNDRLDKNRLDKNNNIVATSATPQFDLKAYLAEMRKNPRRHIQIIALYWEKKNYCFFENKDQCESAIKRDLKAAAAIKSYSDTRISEVMDWLNANADYPWTLESVNKKINENLATIKIIRKKIKPYYHGMEMRQREADKKWFVIKNGEWYEFAGKESEIKWKSV